MYDQLGDIMTKWFRSNESYFKFINKYRDKIIVSSLNIINDRILVVYSPNTKLK